MGGRIFFLFLFMRAGPDTQLSGGGVWKDPKVFILFENIT
jgi:hypothetical protein